MNERNESVFSALSRYCPQQATNPKENYLTELLAWIINNVEPFGDKLIEFLIKEGKLKTSAVHEDNIESEQHIEAVTQQHVTNGYIDMLIYDNIHKIAFICEHKIASELSENQIKKYMDNSNELDTRFTYYSVLVTKSKSQHKENADISIIWRKITQLTKDILTNNEMILSESNQFILEQFINFMNMEGLGVTEPINCSKLKEYNAVLKLTKCIDQICRNLVNPEIPWSDTIPELLSFPEERPTYKPIHDDSWGRNGISFFKPWEPGLFAGIILDGDDHKIYPKDPSKGPDIVILIEGNLRNKETYNNLKESEWYRNMTKRLKERRDSREHTIKTENREWVFSYGDELKNK